MTLRGQHQHHPQPALPEGVRPPGGAGRCDLQAEAAAPGEGVDVFSWGITFMAGREGGRGEGAQIARKNAFLLGFKRRVNGTQWTLAACRWVDGGRMAAVCPSDQGRSNSAFHLKCAWSGVPFEVNTQGYFFHTLEVYAAISGIHSGMPNHKIGPGCQMVNVLQLLAPQRAGFPLNQPKTGYLRVPHPAPVATGGPRHRLGRPPTANGAGDSPQRGAAAGPETDVRRRGSAGKKGKRTA